MTVTAVVACALALSACGGGGDDNSGSTLSRADEGIWSNLNSVGVGATCPAMQAVILSDGSYWGLYGYIRPEEAPISSPTQTVDNVLNNPVVLQGTASVNDNSVSGAYTNFAIGSNGTYSGTVSVHNSLNLTFNDPSGGLTGCSFNMSYDAIYNQPASLSTIAGNYSADYSAVNPGGPVIPVGGSPDNTVAYPQSLTISGSNLTLLDGSGNTIMTGTLAPHGTTVNVFDVHLATPTNGPVAVAAYSGILFQTSSGILKGDVEILATSGNSDSFFYIGKKQD